MVKIKDIRRNNTETTPCKYCKEQTISIGTSLCDRCWELAVRIETDLKLAEIILRDIKRKYDGK